MNESSQNQVKTSLRPMAEEVDSPVFGFWFYWWRPPLTVRSAGVEAD